MTRDRLTHYLKKMHPYMILKGVRYLRHFGWKEFWVRVSERMEPEEVPYGPWYGKYVPTAQELAQQRRHHWQHEILFSILVPVYHTPPEYLREMIESVLAQTYSCLELCIANASPEDEQVDQILKEYQAKDSRIKVRNLSCNDGISGNTNAAMAMARGEFIALLDHDDTLDPSALYQIAAFLEKHPGCDMVYTDEDKISADGKEHMDPHLKPDFNPDLLRSNNYICHFLCVRRRIALNVGGFRKEYDGAQDYDLIFRCAEAAREIGHVPEILYHWRVHRASTADNPASKMYAFEAGRRAIEDHLRRQGIRGTVQMEKDLGFYRVIYRCMEKAEEDSSAVLPSEDHAEPDSPAGQPPLVSIIIPNRDQRESLKKCLDSIRQSGSPYPYEILVIENNSTDKETFRFYEELSKQKEIRLLRWKKPFNYSAINNFGASHARGKYLLFLNNDTEVITENWMEELTGLCARQDVGAVGVRLYYPDDTIQHAGIVVGIGGIAGSMFVGMKRSHSGYLHKAAILQDLSAVTAACTMIRADVFRLVGGFEEKLAVAFNDVDLCLRINEAGYHVVYDPYVELYHDESKTRGAENTKEKVYRFQNEIEYMRSRWTAILKNGDPYYNKNLSVSKWNYSLRDGERMR